MAVFNTIMLIIAIIFPILFQTVSSAVDSIHSFESISDGTTLVSKEGSFEFGFFSLGNSKNRYVGIWYKNIPIRTVVWVANRCNPINDSFGLLTVNSTGNLVLMYQNKSVVWSTNSSKQAKKPLVQLLDSGNLVLRDEEDRNSENYLWQSFDYPSDTVLPGMKFGCDLKKGLNRRLSAWKNWEDPCPGDFTYGVEFDRKLHTYPEFYLRKGNTTYYRTGPWNGIRLSGVLEQNLNQFYTYNFVYNDDEAYYVYNLKNNSVISIIVINQTTSLRQRLTWIEADQAWKPYSSFPRDDCDKYGACGANANCDINENPFCQCLRGFKPKSQEKWNLMDWSEGCARNNPLNCTVNDNDGFIKFWGLKVPDTTHSWVNKSMNTKECRAKCLSNCSCAAFTNTDITGQGTGCAIWFGDLMDIRQIPNGGQDLFIRMPSSELGKTGNKMRAAIVAASVIGGFSGMLMLLLGFCFCRRGSKDKTARNETISQNGGEEDDLDLPLFNLSSIIAATGNFSEDNKLGEGGFGSVYRGKLEDGQEIAVKRLSISSLQGLNELRNEKLIAKLQHRNLVKLLGCCINEKEKLLVYEYMPNKGLDSFIFVVNFENTLTDQNQGKLLDWSKRFKIICGIARGLLYLHQDSRLRVIHRDLKASNVLLDDEMNPKISDFGLARPFVGNQTEEQTTRVIIGTYGYMAPEYAFDGLFSIKSDVFSFGILVLEIVSGKKSRGFQYRNSLIGHAWKLHEEGNSIEMLDKHLRESDHNLKQVLRCIHVGLLCMQQSPMDRPNMSSVVLMLGSESELPQPKPPGYFTEMHSANGDPESSSTNDMSTSLLSPR
ncbi:G-type lectin S-receptor-like serine/threonine-protein kinase At4g27290 [Morus notabilis]|uniref:G-type lectin S-receptor-like serine/threonine-protein kinase At4g27290 n=1 Tax=Morus notabilis TaxID=981085 RepID=UPI000CECEB1D|nr:G-type lectin S-receptor-like serine/threonine-protein kinase At4g27290 [Morus notabilis]